MSDLSPETRALIDMAKDADGPTHVDRARIRSALTRRLAMGAAAGITATAAAKTATAGIVLKLVVSAALLSVAAVVTVKTEEHVAPPPPVVQTAAPRVQVPVRRPAPPAPPPAPVVAEEAPAPPPPKPSAKPAAPVDPTQEILAVREAHAALRSGNGDQALRILEQQAKKPGILAEERAAARVLALCAAGRSKEARAEAARFVATYPRSPQVARVSGACAEIESDNPF